MSPKHPIRPKAPGASNQGPAGIRDTAPDNLPRRPTGTQRHEPDQPQGHQFLEHTQQPDAQPPAIEIIDLPANLHISGITTKLPISNYYLAPKLVERIPAPDPETGIRSIISGRQYVDLDGGDGAAGH